MYYWHNTAFCINCETNTPYSEITELRPTTTDLVESNLEMTIIYQNEKFMNEFVEFLSK